MSNDQAEAEDDAGAPPPARTIYRELLAATPSERVQIVLRLIQEHPEGRLELPACDGEYAVLDEVDLGPEALEGMAHLSGGAAWLDAATGGINLAGANLAGASLRKANLCRALLSGADLRGARLGEARLENARLDEANMREADLAGAHLSGAILSEANLEGAMLEEVDLSGASLRFALLRRAALEEADLQGADLWGVDLQDAEMDRADLRGARFDEANLQGADLSGSDLRGTILKRANLAGANLKGADLREADIVNANLRGTILRDTRLQDLDLGRADIDRVHLSGANLSGTRFGREQLGGAIGEELAGEYNLARKAYLVLERSFEDMGDHDAASWAYRRRRRMQKRAALARGHDALRRRNGLQAIRSYATFATDQGVEWLCDYGESIPRVLNTLLILYLAFGIIYGATGSVAREHETPSGTVTRTTRNPVDLAIFSLLAMTTGSIGVGLLPDGDLALALVGVHVFLGVALVGLLGFVLGNRIRR